MVLRAIYDRISLRILVGVGNSAKNIRRCRERRELQARRPLAIGFIIPLPFPGSPNQVRKASDKAKVVKSTLNKWTSFEGVNQLLYRKPPNTFIELTAHDDLHHEPY